MGCPSRPDFALQPFPACLVCENSKLFKQPPESMIRLTLLAIAAAFFAASCSPAPSGPGPATYVEPTK